MPSAVRQKLVLSVALVAGMACQSSRANSLPIPIPGDRIDDFRLLDHAGRSHQLYYLSDAKAVVLIAQGARCDNNLAAITDIGSLRETYIPRRVEFRMLDSNLTD